ncbi:ATP synthase subunit I [Xanthobacter aminoxidans]|jgi:hypothetical protein|uniref:N-ATPase subunit AtpR n=1 Tax=Xanthobacter aminoxidans TaxID=186280 RepID=UPI0037297D87
MELFSNEFVVTAFHIALGLGAGALVGLAHFATLRSNTALYLGKNLTLGLGLHLLRFAVLGVVLFGLAHLGAAALLSGALGLLIMRRAVLSRAGGLP